MGSRWPLTWSPRRLQPTCEFKRTETQLASVRTERAGRTHARRASQSLLPALRVQRAEDDGAHGVVPPEEEPAGTWAGDGGAPARGPARQRPLVVCRPAERELPRAAEARGRLRASRGGEGRRGARKPPPPGTARHRSDRSPHRRHTHFLWLSVRVMPCADTLKCTTVDRGGGCCARARLRAFWTAWWPVRDSVSTEPRYHTLQAVGQGRASARLRDTQPRRCRGWGASPGPCGEGAPPRWATGRLRAPPLRRCGLGPHISALPGAPSERTPGSSRDLGLAGRPGPLPAGRWDPTLSRNRESARVPLSLTTQPWLSDQKSCPHQLGVLVVLPLRRDNGHTRGTGAKTSATSRPGGRSWQVMSGAGGRLPPRPPPPAQSAQQAATVTVETSAVWGGT